MGHELVNSVSGFIRARFMLGLGEAGSFPVAIKTVAEWFPRKERALATGLFNASNSHSVLAPLTVPWIVGLAVGVLVNGFSQRRTAVRMACHIPAAARKSMALFPAN